MNLTTRNLLATCALATAAAAAPAHAKPVDCAKPWNHGQARACEAAAAGIDSLRQFVWRTRAVYGLYIIDFVPAVPDRMAAQADGNPRTLAAVSR